MQQTTDPFYILYQWKHATNSLFLTDNKVEKNTYYHVRKAEYLIKATTGGPHTSLDMVTVTMN